MQKHDPPDDLLCMRVLKSIAKLLLDTRLGETMQRRR